MHVWCKVSILASQNDGNDKRKTFSDYSCISLWNDFWFSDLNINWLKKFKVLSKCHQGINKSCDTDIRNYKKTNSQQEEWLKSSIIMIIEMVTGSHWKYLNNVHKLCMLMIFTCNKHEFVLCLTKSENRCENILLDLFHTPTTMYPWRTMCSLKINPNPRINPTLNIFDWSSF